MFGERWVGGWEVTYRFQGAFDSSPTPARDHASDDLEEGDGSLHV